MKKSFAIVCVLVSCLWIGACAEGQTNGPPGPDAAAGPDAAGFIDADPFVPDARVFPDANTSFPDANNSIPDGNSSTGCTSSAECGADMCCDTIFSVPPACVLGVEFPGFGCIPA
ncbi:MAG TPA: hypothetical protein VML75_20485 [Kofleriaceae bacterium]|nr:hypothetical protein [Kofleriaceae bacterium]